MALIDIDLLTATLFKTLVIPGIITTLWLSDFEKSLTIVEILSALRPYIPNTVRPHKNRLMNILTLFENFSGTLFQVEATRKRRIMS